MSVENMVDVAFTFKCRLGFGLINLESKMVKLRHSENLMEILKSLVSGCVLLASANLVWAESYPTLSKNWTGSVAIATIGIPSHVISHHARGDGVEVEPKEWRIIEEQRTLRVVQQKGRFVEMILTTPREATRRWTGVLFQGGKKLQVATPSGSYVFDVNANSISGCGTVRGDNGTYDHWLNTYGSICFDFAAVK